jgi:hypothetical protein
MIRLLQILASCALGVLVLATPFVGPAVAWADEDDTDLRINGEEPFNPDEEDATVDGIIYGVRDQAGAKVLTILDNDLGLSIDVFFRDPQSVALINNRTACTNRYAVAEGVRDDIQLMTGQGLQVMTDRPCGVPPQ